MPQSRQRYEQWRDDEEKKKSTIHFQFQMDWWWWWLFIHLLGEYTKIGRLSLMDYCCYIFVPSTNLIFQKLHARFSNHNWWLNRMITARTEKKLTRLDHEFSELHTKNTHRNFNEMHKFNGNRNSKSVRIDTRWTHNAFVSEKRNKKGNAIKMVLIRFFFLFEYCFHGWYFPIEQDWF